MLSGKTHIVREEADDVLEKIETYRKRISPPVVAQPGVPPWQSFKAQE
jgi:uncharacterized protein YlzI (FlbEa/FlbD family)